MNEGERIEAAIAKGEEHCASAGHRGNAIAEHGGKCPWGITAGEVALAALAARQWEYDCEDCQAHAEPLLGCHEPPPALIAYCEKIERLSHD